MGGWRALLLGVSAAFWLGGPAGRAALAGGYSLLYLRTAVSRRGPGPAELGYLEVGYLDGRPIECYDSETGRAVPLAPWMERSARAMEGYWGAQATLARLQQEALGHYLLLLQNYFARGGNRSSSSSSSSSGPRPSGGAHEGGSCPSSGFACGDGACIPWRDICDWSLDCPDGSDEDSGLCTPQGSHTLQCVDGCEVGDDGQETSVHREAYDGRAMAAWEPTWDLYRHRKGFWGRNCTGWLRRHLPYLQEERRQREKEPPVVRVTPVPTTAETLETLSCRAYGFYPEQIHLSWEKDGQPLPPPVDAPRRAPLPNADGTFHAQLSIRIEPRERGLYRCHVEHAGLRGPLAVAWEGPGSAWPLVGGALGAAAALLLLAGVVCYLRTRPSASEAAFEATPAGKEATEVGAEGEASPLRPPEKFELMEKGESSPLPSQGGTPSLPHQHTRTES